MPYPFRVQTIEKTAPIDSLGLDPGDHWVKFHVEQDSISFEIAESTPEVEQSPRPPTGFVDEWSGTGRKLEDESDAWLSHINEKHLR